MGGLAAPEALHDAHDFSEFDCGEPALNNWLQQRALKNESKYSRTYVVCDDAKGVAYASISAGSVEHAGSQKKMRRNAKANGRKSAVRSKVEHVFARQKNRMGLAIRTIGLDRAKATAALANMACSMGRLRWLLRQGQPA